MTTRDDVIEALEEAAAQPWGPARSQMTAEAVARADSLQAREPLSGRAAERGAPAAHGARAVGGEADLTAGLVVDARLALAEAYYRGNEEWKSLAPFAWLLARYHERPDLFTTARLRMMTRDYTRAVPVAADNPAVGLGQLRELEEGLEAFTAAQGGGVQDVRASRLHAAIMTGADDQAAAEADALRAAGSDGASGRDVRALAYEIEWLAAREEWEAAAEAGAPVLAGAGAPSDPAARAATEGAATGTGRTAASAADEFGLHAARSALLVPLLLSGRAREAWDAHLSSYAVVRSAPRVMDLVGAHLEYLALAGRPTRGLEVLREFVRRTDEAQSARALMDVLAGAVLVLRGAEREGLGAEPLDVDVPAFSQWCPGPGISAGTPLHVCRLLIEDWLRHLTARYDARNGNSVVSQRLEARMAREPVEEVDAEDDDVVPDAGGDDAPAVAAQPVGWAAAEAPEAAGPAEPAGSDERAESAEQSPALAGPAEVTDPAEPAGRDEPVESAASPDGATGLAEPAAVGSAGGLGLTGPAAPDDSVATALPIDAAEGDPYPAVDLRRPEPVADVDDLLRRLEVRLHRPGRSLENGFLASQAMSRGLVPDPRAVDPELESTARFLRFIVADYAWDYGAAADELAGLRFRLDGFNGAASPLRLVALDLEALRVDGAADDLEGRASDATRADQLARAEKLATRLTDLAEPLLDEPEDRGDEFVDAYGAAVTLTRILSGLHEYEGADEYLELARLIAPHVEDRVDPVDGALADQLTLLEGEILLGRGDLYGACALADDVLRLHDPCPAVLAEGARSILVRASMEVGENEEAVTQSRELLHIHLSVGLEPLAGPLFGALASALGASGRASQAAEVLRAALESRVPAPLSIELRRALVSVLEKIGDEAGACDNCLLIAEAYLERGRPDRGSTYLLHAAETCERLGENARAAELFERLAELTDADHDAGRVTRARYLRRAARAVVSGSASDARGDGTGLTEARELMTRARGLLDPVPDSRRYSRALEMGDWHDDMAWILWRAGESEQALAHCEEAFAGYMTVRDRGTAAHPLTLMALVYAEEGEEEQAREVIAQVRELLAHRRWADHPALARVADLEASLA